MTRQILAYNYMGVAWAKIAQMYAIICAHDAEKSDKELAAIWRASYMLTETCFPKMIADGGKPRYTKDGRIQAVEYRGFKFQALGDATADADYFEYVRGYLHTNTTEFMTYRDLSDTFKIDGYNLSFRNALGLIDDFSKNGYCPDFCGYDVSISSRLQSILYIRDTEKIDITHFKGLNNKERALCIHAIIRSLPIGYVENYTAFEVYDIRGYIEKKEVEYLRKEHLCDPNATDEMIRFRFPEDTADSLEMICEEMMPLYAEIDGIIYFLPAVVKAGCDVNDIDAIIANTKTYMDLKVSLNTKEFTVSYPNRIYTEAERHPYGAAGRYYNSDYNRVPEADYSFEDFFVGDIDIPFNDLTHVSGIMQYVPKDMTLVTLAADRNLEQEDPMARW